MPQVPVGDTCQNIDRDAGSNFLNLKYDQIIFFCVGKFLRYLFLGFAKFPLFWGVFQFLYHIFNPLNKEHTGHRSRFSYLLI